LNTTLTSLSEDQMLQVEGGNKIVDIVNGACGAYAMYAVIALSAGVTPIGVGSIGAFCAGWKLADLIF